MWWNLSSSWLPLWYFAHNSKATQCHNEEITLLTAHQQWIHWNSILLQWAEACVDGSVLSCFQQWVCSAPGTSVFLMSGTPASGCPGTPLLPGLTDTSSSTSLRVWTCCYGDKTVLITLFNSTPHQVTFVTFPFRLWWVFGGGRWRCDLPPTA